MRVREAKDLLVQLTAEQAAIENVPPSPLEKRMMYFTESGDLSEDPAKLNEEFEATHDTDEFEGKISILLHHAYKRVKKENPESVRRWDDAIRTLRKGDHYLLVLWDKGPRSAHPTILSSSLELAYSSPPRCSCLPLPGTYSLPIFQALFLAGLRAT